MPRPRKPASPFRYFNSSPEVIRLVVMMYVRFPLSLRNVEDLLFERGIDICHETIRLWWNRFGPMFAADIRRQRVSQMKGFRHWNWHLDEVFVKVNGERHYLWRAVDHEGEVLESYVTKKRDKAAALAFLKKALKRHVGAMRSSPTACDPILLRCVNWAISSGARWAAGSITGRKTAISHSDDGSAPCSDSGG